MSNRAEEIVAFIQERCLWQFFSRSWDREENIQGVIDILSKIIKSEHVALETPAARCLYADAKILAVQIKERCTWIADISTDELDVVLDAVKARITEITITKSQNGELKIAAY